VKADTGFVWGFGDGQDHTLDVLTTLTLADNWVLKLVDLGEDPLTSQEYELFVYGTTYTGDAVFSESLLNIVIDATDAPDWHTENLTVTAEGGIVRISGVGKTGITGDTNGDGVVDATDYITLKLHMGQATGAGAADGDFNEDGKVDWNDLQALMGAINAGGASGETIPEPATLFVMMAAGLPALLKRRRSRS